MLQHLRPTNSSYLLAAMLMKRLGNASDKLLQSERNGRGVAWVFGPADCWYKGATGLEGRAMGQARHGCATTTHAMRAAIQRSEASIATLSRRYGINPKTVMKWRKRSSVEDREAGPKDPRSTVLNGAEEAIVVAFRRHTLLPLDDCLWSLQATIPHLSRSSLHRCLKRHGINRLPGVDGDKSVRKTLKPYTIGFFHIDLAELCTAGGKLYLFIAIDRTSKFAFAQLAPRADNETAIAFLEALLAIVPYRIHTILTDDSSQFADLPKDRKDSTANLRHHPFDRACEAHGIEHRLARPNHPWTDGQAERMNRTIEQATAKRCHDDDHQQLSQHVEAFVHAYNAACRLKTLKGLTPYEFICQCWTTQPGRFSKDPTQLMPGPST